MGNKNLQEEKKIIVESLGVYFENEKLTPPLAGRIKAILIINGEKGTTFDEIVTDLGASKSAISTHLNSLIAQGNVYYFTKSGERKRYFAMVPGYINRKINGFIRLWSKEIEIHNQILDYKIKYNKINKDSQISLTKHEDAVRFLKKSIDFFEGESKKYKE